MQSYINDSSKNLIFLGSNSALTKYTDLCDKLGIKIEGIIDNDYFGNTEHICDIPVIDSEENIAKYSDRNFFCATNWLPMQDPISIRDKQKRKHHIEIINRHNLDCISLVDPLTSVSKSVKIGKNVFIDALTLIESNVTIGDFTSIYSQCAVGHDTIIGHNCVLQRVVGLTSRQIVEDDVYFALGVRSLKSGARFGKGTFVHEMLYLCRGTIENEIVSLNGKNTRRVKEFLDQG